MIHISLKLSRPVNIFMRLIMVVEAQHPSKKVFVVFMACIAMIALAPHSTLEEDSLSLSHPFSL